MTTKEDMAGADAMSEQLEKEGYQNIQTVKMGPNDPSVAHLHETASVHIVLVGDLVVTDATGTKIHHRGEKVEFPAGSRHTAKGGPRGIVMLVGQK